MMTKVAEGSYVLFADEGGRKWLAKAERGRELHTHHGVITLDDVIGVEYGSAVETHTGEVLWALEPLTEDFIMKAARPTQIIYPKDAGYLIVKAGVKCGDRVVEVGTGSWAFTTLLSRVVGPEGRVYTYEIDEKRAKLAMKNLERAGATHNVELKVRDAKEGVDERGVDAFFVDVGDPWALVDVAHEALKGGRVLAVLTPTYNQAEKVVRAMVGKFTDVETVELMLRRVLVRPGKTRPSNVMVGYTALLTTGRKIFMEGRA